MELQILTSKKGTKVVTATSLHFVLQLPNQNYASNVKKWINELYGFKDGIRKPIRMQDFAKRKVNDNPVLTDYYFSLELAKLITLNSKSKMKQKYAKWLSEMEAKEENPSMLTKDQILAILEITKVMSLVSCQESSERQHLKTYEARNGGSAGNWWRHRAQILGYSSDKLKHQLKLKGKEGQGKSQRQMLRQLDKYEMIRTGVIDLFMAMGKSEQYSKYMGDLAKAFAKELNVDVFDDKVALPAFAPEINPELINEVKGLKKERVLKLWT